MKKKVGHRLIAQNLGIAVIILIMFHRQAKKDKY